MFCRCRPLTKEEVLSGCATMVDFDAAKEGDIGIMTGGSTKKAFKFDRVYTPKNGQGNCLLIQDLNSSCWPPRNLLS